MSASSQIQGIQDPSRVNDGLTDDQAPPPPYSAVNTDTHQGHADPPAYNEVIKLPSYGEVVAMHRVNAIREYFNLSDDDFEENSVTDPPIVPVDRGLTDESALGTDQNFIVCFLLSFILNWIGFLVGFCLGSTLAAQNGALCGFGLSLIKWALVIQTSKCWDVSVNQPWVIWVFILIGLIMFIKGAIDHIHLKRNRRGRRLWFI